MKCAPGARAPVVRVDIDAHSSPVRLVASASRSGGAGPADHGAIALGHGFRTRGSAGTAICMRSARPAVGHVRHGRPPGTLAVQIAVPADPRVRNLVAERDGTVVGWASSAEPGDADATSLTGELWGIYVHPDHWRTGAGGALMQAALDHLAAEGYTEATLWVFEENAAGEGFL